MSKRIGVLMLETTFERPIGDIGNKDTFSFPIVYKTVKGASVDRVVTNTDQTVLAPFIQAAKDLEKEGVQAITTSCGFLAIFQTEIQHQLEVPFFSSSLLQIPLIHMVVGGLIGIITASKKHLTVEHLQGVFAHQYPLAIEGMEEMPAFAGAIINEKIQLDKGKVQQEIKHVTEKLITNNPKLSAIVLECTNLPPYKEAMREVTSLPIFDITTLTKYIYEATY